MNFFRRFTNTIITVAETIKALQELTSNAKFYILFTEAVHHNIKGIELFRIDHSL